MATRKPKTKNYRSEYEYLEDCFRLIDLLQKKKQIKECEIMPEETQEQIAKIKNKVNRQIQIIRERKKNSNRTFAVDKIAEQHQLHPIEKKILLFLLYRYFTSESNSTTGRLVLENVARNRVEMMRYHSFLREDGNLRREKLVHSEDPLGERSVLELDFSIPEEIISRILGEKKTKKKNDGNDEKSYRSYLQLYFSLISLMEEKVEILNFWRKDEKMDALDLLSRSDHRDLHKIRYEIQKNEKLLEEFGKIREKYPLEEVTRQYQLNRDEKLMLLVLLRDSLGLSDSFMGYEGKKLLAIISESESEMIAKRSLLYKKSKLRENKLVHVDRNWVGQNILDAEYFLTEKMIRRLLDDHWQQENSFDEELQDHDEEGNVLSILEPRFGFDDVILPENKKKYIEIALSQQINRKLIFEDWGFSKNIPYGNALTMLFSGAPGTGKTMMAEAIADHLSKKLLIANYSQIQNMYVGETEKRIVSTFRKAQEENGVLLWDEADSMFFSREIARNSWEFRDVNVILQELEKFSGTVILTTNRDITLDRALERRIAVKMKFDMPGPEQREAIWRRLIPQEAPLNDDVDLKKLAQEHEISGGIIKNAILHAARHAAYRKGKNIVMADFVRGIKLEVENGWQKNKVKIGFNHEK